MRPDQASSIIIRPYVTENTFDRIEKENKLVFLVSNDATKNTIKQALSILYEVKVKSINTAQTIKGKKAFVTFDESSAALDLATKLGVM